MAAPAQPTVGDTVWLERLVPARPGWRVHAQKEEPASGAPLEPVAEPLVGRVAGGWMVRYAVVAWAPGRYAASPPPLLQVAPDGRVDSLPRDTAWFRVWSVLPDSADLAAAQPALEPLRPPWRRPLPPLAAALSSAGLLTALVRWRRRPQRGTPSAPSPFPRAGPHVPVEPEVPDTRWLTAGEPKAVAARAAHRLRAAIAQAVPAAHEALAVAECLEVLERARPAAPLRDVRDVLTALDHVAFASAHGADVPGLAVQARRLAGGFAA